VVLAPVSIFWPLSETHVSAAIVWVRDHPTCPIDFVSFSEILNLQSCHDTDWATKPLPKQLSRGIVTTCSERDDTFSPRRLVFWQRLDRFSPNPHD
jgi:hypothetical protein